MTNRHIFSILFYEENDLKKEICTNRENGNPWDCKRGKGQGSGFPLDRSSIWFYNNDVINNVVIDASMVSENFPMLLFLQDFFTDCS